MMEAAHRVALLLEDIQTNGLPSQDQIEAAILGDNEPRVMEAVLGEEQLNAIGRGGLDGTDQARKLWHVSEMYRLELMQVMRYAGEQLTRAQQSIRALSEEQTRLINRVAMLETLRAKETTE